MSVARVEQAAVRLASTTQPLIDRLLRMSVVRCRLRRRALVAWVGTDAPLVLCLGNINRSPFAAALARQRPGSRATSSGFFPRVRRSVPARTVLAATRFGVDLSTHRSERLDRSSLMRADAVFVFDLENLLRVGLVDWRALRRTHLLGAMAGSGPVCIEDPHGRPDEALYPVLDRIAEAVEAGDRAR